MPALNPRAALLLQWLDARPGLNLDELAALLQVRRTAGKHHIQRLERLGLVVRVRQGREVLHFLGSTPLFERDMVRLLRVPSIHQVANALFHEPGMSLGGLAETLGLSTRTVRRAMAELRRNDLLRVESAQEGRRTHLHPQLRILLVRRPYLAAPGEPGAPPLAAGGADIP